MKKLFLYIFYPNWIIYESTTIQVTSSYKLGGYIKIPGTERVLNLTLNILYSKNRHKYKLQVLGLEDVKGVEKLPIWQSFTTKVYNLNHSKL